MKGCRLEGQVSPGVQGGPVPGGAKAGPGARRLHGGCLGRRLQRKCAVEDVAQQPGEAAAELAHRLLHVPPQWMARQDAEVAVDIGNDGADGPAADQGGDLLGRGQVGETRIGSLGWRGGGRPGLGRGSGCARPWSLVQPGGAAEHSRLKRLGEVQAAGDAREDHRKIGGAEAGSGEDGIGGDALADRGCECRAVVDQLADEGEQAAGAAGLGVGLGGWL